MKRILATAGIAALALIGATAPANANPEDQTNSCETAQGGESVPSTAATCVEETWGGGGGWKDDDKDHGWKDDDDDHGWKDDDDDDWGHDWKEVTICHATGSADNPYVVITVSERAWLKWHQDGHNGLADIYPVPAGGCVQEEPETPPVVTPPVVTPPVVTPPVVTPPVVAPPAVVPPAVVPAGAGAGAGAAAAPVVNRGFNAQTAVGTQPGSGMPAWIGGLAALFGAAGFVVLRHRGRLQDGPASK